MGEPELRGASHSVAVAVTVTVCGVVRRVPVCASAQQKERRWILGAAPGCESTEVEREQRAAYC
jgi:hypothetical protein